MAVEQYLASKPDQFLPLFNIVFTPIPQSMLNPQEKTTISSNVHSFRSATGDKSMIVAITIWKILEQISGFRVCLVLLLATTSLHINILVYSLTQTALRIFYRKEKLHQTKYSGWIGLHIFI